jgi:tetratricopeptide (TPR) repeat protein
MPERPLCFVLMPFGVKPDGAGGVVDFDAVYEEALRPAVEAAGMEPLRADEELDGGIIHKLMFERLILCKYAIADLTTANANVFYELGVRHAVRPHSTVLVFAEKMRLPFDVAPMRAVPYALDDRGAPASPDFARGVIEDRLNQARDPAVDSPVFELVEDFPDVDHHKTDVFREMVRYSVEVKARLAEARMAIDLAALQVIEGELSPLEDQEAGIAVDLLLSYRALKAWKAMVALVDRMRGPLVQSVLVREQLAFALNRLGDRERAERVLLDILEERGPSSETLGLLGRVYKDRWEEAREAGDSVLARGEIRKAIDAYRRGFEADWRDAYPGVNVVTLMEVAEPPDSERLSILPVVSYAVQRRLADERADYWDHATRLELAVLRHDREDAEEAVADAIASIREPWEPVTTLRNLRLVREARERRGEGIPKWQLGVERALASRTKGV